MKDLVLVDGSYMGDACGTVMVNYPGVILDIPDLQLPRLVLGDQVRTVIIKSCYGMIALPAAVATLVILGQTVSFHHGDKIESKGEGHLSLPLRSFHLVLHRCWLNLAGLEVEKLSCFRSLRMTQLVPWLRQSCSPINNTIFRTQIDPILRPLCTVLTVGRALHGR